MLNIIIKYYYYYYVANVTHTNIKQKNNKIMFKFWLS